MAINRAVEVSDSGPGNWQSYHERQQTQENYETYLKSLTSDPSKNRYVSLPRYPIVNAPFITLEILGNPTNVSLTWRNEAPDYFTSLTHERYIKEACRGTISLSYVPQLGEDPSKIEAAIWSGKGNCKFQYGLTGYQSPVYGGLIYNYSVSMSEGRLDYKLDIVSKEIGYLNRLIQDESYNIPNKQKRDVYNRSHSVRSAQTWVIELIRKIITNYLDENYEFEDLTELDANHSPSYDLQDSELSLIGDNPLKALQRIADHLYPKNGDVRIIYYIVIDDETNAQNSKGKIKLMQTNNYINKIYSFNWNHRDSSVLSWSPQYQGTAEIFTSDRSSLLKDASKTTFSALGLDTNGSYQLVTNGNLSTLRNTYEDKFKTLINTLVGSDYNDIAEINDTLIKSYNDIAAYPYKATMEVLGLPTDEFILGTHIQVNPYINGVLHHTHGEYMITKIKDQVSSSGFTTELEMVRIDADIVEPKKSTQTSDGAKIIRGSGGGSTPLTRSIDVIM